MVTSNLSTLYRVSVAEANRSHDCLPQRLYPKLNQSSVGDFRMLEDNDQLKKAVVQTKTRLVRTVRYDTSTPARLSSRL